MSDPHGDGPLITDEGQPPFFRGCATSGVMGVCDRLLHSGNCCDVPAAYAVTWKRTMGDGDSIPVSGVCRTHVVLVDRRLVEVIATYPPAVRA